MQDTLEKMNEESEAKYKSVQEQDAEERKQISEELKVKIAEADELSKELAQREQQAASRKNLFLRQQEIYDSHSSSGREKFDELVAKREVETASLAEKKEESLRRKPELEAQLAEETAELATAREAQEVLKAKVDEYLARFGEIQSQLSAAKKVYEAASSNKDRSLRALKALESDLEMLRRRVAMSKADRDKEQAKITALEEKAEAMRAQIIRFDNISKMLEESAETPEE